MVAYECGFRYRLVEMDRSMYDMPRFSGFLKFLRAKKENVFGFGRKNFEKMRFASNICTYEKLGYFQPIIVI